MGNYNWDDRGGNRGGRNSFGGNREPRRSFGGPRKGFGRGDKTMFKTTCSNCGKECEVPFNPTSGKPVFCSDCFEKMGGRNGRDGSQRPERSSFRPQTPNSDKTNAQIEVINAKLDKILKLLEPEAGEVESKPKALKAKKSSSKK